MPQSSSLARTAAQALRRLRRSPAGTPTASPDQGSSSPATPEELYDYWRQPTPQHHDPVEALGKVARSEALLQMLPGGPTGLEPDSRILEIGSGGGRNLAHLVDHGYTRVEGVEISQHAVDLMRRTYPQLADVTIHVGPAEEVLAGMPDDEYRLVFSMGTLQHIHPDKSELFDHMVRISSNVLAIEGPPRQLRRRFPHDFQEVFTSRGMASAGKPRKFGKLLPPDDGLNNYRVHTFRRMESLAKLREFWTQAEPQGNVPADYVNPIGRSRALLTLVSDLPKDARILEVGCNVGRNLAYLHDNGYTSVEGVEISPHAVELLRKTYPQLAECQVHLGPAGDVLPSLADDEFDLVFTMAVIEHIHPDEASVFDDMVRVGKQVLAIEPKNRLTHRQFPHDVVELFTSRGMEAVSETWMGDFLEDGIDEGMTAFTAYRFRRP